MDGTKAILTWMIKMNGMSQENNSFISAHKLISILSNHLSRKGGNIKQANNGNESERAIG